MCHPAILLSVLHTIGRNLDKNIQTVVIYLDFAKAFDTVDHNVLLSKLKAYGVSGKLQPGSLTTYLGDSNELLSTAQPRNGPLSLLGSTKAAFWDHCYS